MMIQLNLSTNPSRILPDKSIRRNSYICICNRVLLLKYYTSLHCCWAFYNSFDQLTCFIFKCLSYILSPGTSDGESWPQTAALVPDNRHVCLLHCHNVHLLEPLEKRFTIGKLLNNNNQFELYVAPKVCIKYVQCALHNQGYSVIT